MCFYCSELSFFSSFSFIWWDNAKVLTANFYPKIIAKVLAGKYSLDKKLFLRDFQGYSSDNGSLEMIQQLKKIFFGKILGKKPQPLQYSFFIGMTHSLEIFSQKWKELIFRRILEENAFYKNQNYFLLNSVTKNIVYILCTIKIFSRFR